MIFFAASNNGVSLMRNFGISTSSPLEGEGIDGKIFELYEKTVNREFKSHVQFIRASTLCEAEDIIAVVEPEYWRTKSIRSVKLDYAWETFTNLYFSYSTAKSVLGLDKMFGE